MIITHNNYDETDINIRIRDVQLSRVTSTKFLGVTIGGMEHFYNKINSLIPSHTHGARQNFSRKYSTPLYSKNSISSPVSIQCRQTLEQTTTSPHSYTGHPNI